MSSICVDLGSELGDEWIRLRGRPGYHFRGSRQGCPVPEMRLVSSSFLCFAVRSSTFPMSGDNNRQQSFESLLSCFLLYHDTVWGY